MGAYVNVNYPVVIRHGEEGCHAHVPTFEINVKGTDIDEAMGCYRNDRAVYVRRS